MNQLLPGLRHWRTHHGDIDHDVDCYWATSAGVSYVLDPLTPEEGLQVFDGAEAPRHVYMTNRLHDRSCADFAARFDAPIWCPRSGLHEYADGSLKVTPYDAGDLRGGLRAIEIGVICPDEMALLLPIEAGVLAIADSFIRYGDEIGFVPDYLMGDNAGDIKRRTKARFLNLCDEIAFDHLLFAHGTPWIGGGHDALRTFCASRYPRHALPEGGRSRRLPRHPRWGGLRRRPADRRSDG